MRILVVDDQELNCTLLKFMLEQESHQVFCVSNGKQAVEQLITIDPDIVLLDVLMPIMDGFEAAPLIKKQVHDVYLPIIFITALDDKASLIRCLEVGGDDFISKPFDKIILSAKIKAHSRTRELSQNSFEQNKLLERYQNEVQREHEIVEHIFNNALVEHLNVPDIIDYHLSPASMFNGDIFLVSPSPIGGLYILLGDFTGHGLAAAIGALPVSKIFYSMAHKGLTVGEIASELNTMLADLLPGHMFCAASILELNKTGRSVSAWLGGLPDGYLLDMQGKVKKSLESQHMALGILETYEFEDTIVHFEVENTDRILVFTDGIIEASDINDNFFGEERVLELMSCPEKSKINDVVNAVKEFSGDIAQQDDLSLALINCKETALPDEEPRSFSQIPMSFTVKLNHKQLKHNDPIVQFVDIICSIEGASEHRSNLFLLLSEAYNNALDHGILKLDSSIKDTEEGFYEYYDNRAQALATLESGELHFEASYLPETQNVIFSIEDSGSGFCTAHNHHADNKGHSYGRGLGLMEEIASSITYNDIGNKINIYYCLNERATA
ncbi:fused response regulator/phosphatase [Pseudoalteromonas denitrificans]|uniref:Histidine kinase-like ATPase domain-containing protein n=1 Tax=Pseudoalteromonas denitrificans DSM 6059 TaxID=1123010 RepID=A0A1I1MJM4_9GAMM|nr:fused response regulator/phosphatase [Pseudoalteromonas denitrificans]SFC85581.1 Histidine kinase-like ATPase domain-containing protein [Pseudoalteromonas denitrificans DSM 6059]